MKICVLDLEMNQPSGNIIEIGAVCLDIKKQTITSEYSQLVILPDGETLNPDIEKLTGITEVDLVIGGIPLPEALNDFWDWCQDNGCANFLAAWGNDYHDVVHECKANGVQYPRRLRTLNLKSMAMILRNVFPNRKQRGGLRNTLETFGLEFSGIQHRALPDAINTAKLVSYFFGSFKLSEDVKGLVKHDT